MRVVHGKANGIMKVNMSSSILQMATVARQRPVSHRQIFGLGTPFHFLVGTSLREHYSATAVSMNSLTYIVRKYNHVGCFCERSLLWWLHSIHLSCSSRNRYVWYEDTVDKLDERDRQTGPIVLNFLPPTDFLLIECCVSKSMPGVLSLSSKVCLAHILADT